MNVFPSDIEFVIRNIPELSGEYRITAYTEKFSTKFSVEVERAIYDSTPAEQLIGIVSTNIKARVGVKPSEVKILDYLQLPRATHKAVRLIDKREK